MANMTTQEILQGIKDWAAPKVIYDISAAHNNTKYTDLADALGTNGGNIPQEYRKGGITVRYICSYDNKYVQYRLTTDEWSIDTKDWAIADEGVYLENPEFVYVKTDAEGKILWAIKTDGTIYYGAGVPPQVVNYINEKIAELSLDEYENIVAFLNGLEEGDKTLQQLLNEKVDKVEGKSLIDAEYASTKSTIDSPEFLDVTLDAEGKVLEGIQKDGTKVIGGNLKVNGEIENDSIKRQFDSKLDSEGLDSDALSTIELIDNPEYIALEIDSEDKILSGRNIDGSKFENLPMEFKDKVSIKGNTIDGIQDPEDRIEIKTDSDDKIISYRKKDGTLVENAGIETNHIELTEQGMNDFQQSLIDAGFNPKMPIDWSDEKELHLPIPRTCAKVNLIVSSLPSAKFVDYEGYVEYVDFDGNYFRKKMVLNAQGQSSMNYIEKNFTLDLDDDSKIQFGDWVSQDSFHLKAYYIDVFRGINNICYKWTNKIIEYLGCRANRVLNNPSSVTTENGVGIFTTDFGSSALCQPDGFPIEVYHNGTYHGLYALNLKKHRDNYQMKKDNYTQALLDGDINETSFFGGTIDWTKFELRNPKKLILEDGTTEYDGDAPAEIIGTNSTNYDSSNANHVKTATTKTMIEEVAECTATISTMPTSTASDIEAIKALFETHYDVEMIKCYFILSNVIFHNDGFRKNWIWTIYNGMAAPTFYDMDTVFGKHWTGGMMWGNNTTTAIIGTSQDNISPAAIVANFYKDELDVMYKDLRDNNLISVPAIMSQIYKWVDVQTLEAIQRNLKKWTAIPSYRANGGTYPPPLSYSSEYQTDGMYDGPARVEKWLTARISTLDNYFNY